MTLLRGKKIHQIDVKTNFTKIPNCLLAPQPELNYTDRLILMSLFYYPPNYTLAYTRIAKDVGINKTTLINHWKILLELEYIQIVNDKYQVNLPKLENNIESNGIKTIPNDGIKSVPELNIDGIKSIPSQVSNLYYDGIKSVPSQVSNLYHDGIKSAPTEEETNNKINNKTKEEEENNLEFEYDLNSEMSYEKAWYLHKIYSNDRNGRSGINKKYNLQYDDIISPSSLKSWILSQGLDKFILEELGIIEKYYLRDKVIPTN